MFSRQARSIFLHPCVITVCPQDIEDIDEVKLPVVLECGRTLIRNVIEGGKAVELALSQVNTLNSNSVHRFVI